MKTEQAIELLHRISDSQFDGPHGDERREALEMAVKALEGDGDTISRQQAIDALDKHIDTFDAIDTNYLCGLRTAMSILKEMPSAQPETHDKRTETHECDLINRQQAIDAVKDLPNCRNGFSDTYDKACIIGVLEDLPTAQPHWIPCSKRLPEKSKGNEDTEYLVTIDNGEFKYVTSDYWINWFGNWRWNDSEAIAWMPFPEPYGGESDD